VGIGLVAIQTSAKKEQSGSPFAAGSAHNGTSIDAAGKVVLGNDISDPLAPARLTSDREIIVEDTVNLFGLNINAAVTGITTRLEGADIQINGGNNTSPALILSSSGALSANQIQMNNTAAGDNDILLVTDSLGGNNLISMQATAGGSSALLARTTGSGTAQLRINSLPDSLEIFSTGNGFINFQIDQINTVWRIQTSTFNTQIGPTLVTFNGAGLQVSGSFTGRDLVQGQGAGTYNVDRDLDSRKLFTNSGAAIFQLPNMSAALLRAGFILRLTIDNVAGATVQTFAGQTIRFGASATSVGGTISSIVVGSTLEIVLINSATWVTRSFTGTWVLT